MTQHALPKIRILATGGTIAGLRTGTSEGEYESGVLGVERLLASVPDCARHAALGYEQVANVGSEDMNEEIWFDLANAVRRALDEDGMDGVVILHGTDTMEETAFFLDLLAEWSKPVVMTGAMRPADAMGADGPVNVDNAVRLAASPAARGIGVLVCMNGCIHAARHVCKTDTIALDAFRSPLTGPLGRMVDGVPRLYTTPVPPVFRSAFSQANREMLPAVAILYGHAGQDGALVDAAVAAGVRGIVFAGVGMGQIHRDVREALRGAVERGVTVVRASRVGNGPVVESEKYRRDGIIPAGNLNPQKARVLLQLALAVSEDVRVVREMFAGVGAVGG